MIRTKILYVEDELNLGTIVTETLEQKGFEVVLVRDGAKVLSELKKKVFDICLLDVMLPHIDGYALGKEIKKSYADMPIIFLTAKTQTQDVVMGFASGGTDYIRKPFSVDELVVRIHNQLQLYKQQAANENIQIGSFTLHADKCELVRADIVYKLSNREMEVLSVLVRYINKTIDRRALLIEVWGDDSIFHSRNLDVYIRKLREYFSVDPNIEIITLKGKGYRFFVG